LAEGTVKTNISPLDPRRLAARRFDDEMAVVDLRARMVHTMNVTASHLWDLIGKGATFDELVRSLSATFEIDAVLAERDVSAFLESLEEAGLVKIH
jgi:hypothetical protein